MPRPFRDLCDALNGTLTPALVGAGYAAPDEPFNRKQDRYEFKRALPSGHRHTVAVLFNRRRTPEFTIQLFIEPPEGMAALVAHGGSLIFGTLSSARPIWPIGVRRFGTKRSLLSRLLRRRAPTAADAIQRALAMLPEVETWWDHQRDTRHIITGTVQYPKHAGGRRVIEPQVSSAPGGTDVFGHPRGLVYLCVSEGWERFSYFGMQSLLVLYMTHQLLMPGHVDRVIGFDMLRLGIEWVTGPLSTGALASQIFGLYTGLVYLTPLLGGLLADRWSIRTATVTAGAMLMALGHFLMAFEPAFLLAMTLLVTGVGCFKGNIASQVGELYDRDDRRRPAAFQVFQFSVASAVMVSPLVCGTLGEKAGWHFGFGAAGVGMLIGLALYLHGRRWLPVQQGRTSADGHRPTPLSPREWRVLVLLVLLLPLIAGAMVGNQQMFNAFVVWGEANFDLMFLGYEMPVTWLLSFDALISALCLVLIFAFWRAFARRWKEPDDLVKIAVGAALMALAPLLLSVAGLQQQATGARVSIGWGLAFELVNELGFAMLVPVALSFYSSVAPKPVQGMTIAMFYLNSFLCNLAVGRLGGLLEQMTAASFWLLHAAIVTTAAALLALVAYWGRQWFSPAGG